MPTIDLGSVVGPQGEQGNTGPQGEQGVAGPSLISASTQTTLTGVLAGDGSTVGVRAVDATPTNNSTNLVSSGGVYTKIANDVAASYQRTCNPNLLDNWYFVGGGTGDGIFPVNQRGQTSYTGSGRKFDRWGFGSTGGSMTLLESGVQVDVSGASNQTFSQNLGINPVELLGHVVTVSLLTASGTLYSASGTLPSTKPTSTNTYITVAILGVGNLTVGYASGVQRFSCGVSNSSASSTSITIAAMKLELGNQQTLCHNEGTTESPVWVLNEIPNYATELLKCQRYYYNTTASASHILVVNGLRGDGTAGHNIGAQVITPVVMRSAPTVDAAMHSIRGNGSIWASNLSVSSTPLAVYGNIVTLDVQCSSASFPAYTNGYGVLFSKLNLSAEI